MGKSTEEDRAKARPDALEVAREHNHHPGYCSCDKCIQLSGHLATFAEQAIAAATPEIERRARVEALTWAKDECCPGIDMVDVIAAEIARLKGDANATDPA